MTKLTQDTFRSLRVLSAIGLCSLAGAALAQAPAEPQGVLNLSASATVEVPRDWMSLSFQATREGADAVAVQSQLKQALDAALAEARRIAKPGQVELQSGGFSIYPRYGSKGQISGWQGSTQLVVSGRDMAAIGQLSGRIATMTIGGVQYSLSREAREQVENELSAQAIARFRSRAADQAKAFGYAGFTVRDVNVQVEQSTPPMPMPKVAMAMARSADEAALSTEAGKGTVTAVVSGSVQMR